MMNKTKLIVISVTALIVLLLAGWVLSIYNGNQQKEQEIHYMTEVPQEYTYEDMIAVSKIGSTDTVSNKKSAAQTTVDYPAYASDSDAKTYPEGEVAAVALKDIKARLKDDIIPVVKPGNINKNSDKETGDEDAIIRQIIRQNQIDSKAVPYSAPVPAPSAIPAVADGIASPLPVQVPIEQGSIAQPVTIKAVVLNEVEVTNGATVSIMLLAAANVNGVQLGKNVVVPGVVTISTNRLFITVTGGNINGKLTDISLNVYGMDGLQGLPILSNAKSAGAQQAAREEIEKSIDGAVQGNRVLGGVVRVLKSFGASGGNSEETVKIPAGHKVLLKTTL